MTKWKRSEAFKDVFLPSGLNPDFEDMVGRIYPPELQLNKANTYITEAPFWIYNYLFQTHLLHPKFMISERTLISIVTFPFMDWDLPYYTAYGVNISQIIRFARVPILVTYFNALN